MRLQPLQRYRIKQVIRVTIFWILIGVLLELHNAINYNPATGQFFFYPHFGNSMAEHLLITAAGPLLGGLIFGTFIIFFVREKIKTRSYGRKLLIHSLIYIIALFVCIALVGFLGALADNTGKAFLLKLNDAVFNLRVLRLMFDWYLIVIVTLFLLDVSERYGQGILKKTLLGKYHRASRENRVFMFLDLKSSTSIAEKIGEEIYFDMLKQFYGLANKVIVNSIGEIYQYVGDEVVVSWEETDAVRQANCLACFYGIKQAVQQSSEEFLQRYGVIPDFKAAIHAGPVATGQIGLVKKEIVYSGDVLNATARMVSLCKHYQADLLISDRLLEKLNAPAGYHFQYLDSPDLRGKTARLGLYSVTKTSPPH